MRRAVVVVMVAAALVISGCGNDEPSDYDDATQSSFLNVCKEDYGGSDSVCVCAYRGFVANIPYGRFKRVNDRLEQDPSAELPDDFTEIWTDCVIADGGGSAGTTPEFPTTTTTADPGASTSVTGGATTTTGLVVTDATAAP